MGKGKQANDVFAEVTAKVVAMIEEGIAAGDKWVRPWSVKGGWNAPFNVVSKKPYRGGNVWAFLVEQTQHGYPTGEWASYKQWADKGAQVRKGEKATFGVYWKTFEKQDKNDPTKTVTIPVPFAFSVFNAAQVDGYTTPELVEGGLSESERLEAVEGFFTQVGAQVRFDGASAFYAPVQDYIGMPAFEQFADPAAYYSTLAHEHIHWTGHESRLARSLKNRFGDDAYAAEELIAELGAAFLSTQLQITVEPREDHAHYLAHWLKVLKADPKALFTASTAAQKAADFLIAKGSPAPAEEAEDLVGAQK